MFIDALKSILYNTVPCKTVRLKTKDPHFVTPLIKSLLVKRCRLRKHGRIEQADALAKRINHLISVQRSRHLTGLAEASPKDLWAAVRKSNGSSRVSPIVSHLLADPDLVNQFFANLSTTRDYNDSDVLSLKSCDTHSIDGQHINAIEVEQILRRLKNTSPGIDNIPTWVFRSCSYELADLVANIFSCSFLTGDVPASWLTAVITPVPKISHPHCLSDFRPISVTPILSRIAEKIVVRKWLRPSIPSSAIADQYAFKPTGSTDAALVRMMHSVTYLLETNNFVRCLMVDFSKAFDTVDHIVLVRKLRSLGLPANIFNWIISFLTGRTQCCKVNGVYSAERGINLSIVQGSGIGPSLYIVMESDLNPLSRCNILIKYADDTNLLVPEHTECTLTEEFTHICDWAQHNKMRINKTKTKELVFHRPHPAKFDMPHTFDGIVQEHVAKLLGVFFSANLSFDEHVNFVMSVCSQRIYLLKLLRSQGLPPKHLQTVFTSLILSRITYALSVWGGHLTCSQRHRINAFLKRAQKFGSTEILYNIEDLLEKADARLFGQMQNPVHCLNSILPNNNKPENRLLRKRGHPFTLPHCTYNLYKNSFLPRCLFKFV